MGGILCIIILIITTMIIYSNMDTATRIRKSEDGFTYVDAQGKLRFIDTHREAYWECTSRYRVLCDKETKVKMVWARDIYNRKKAIENGEQTYEIVDSFPGEGKGLFEGQDIRGEVESNLHVYTVQANGKEYLIDIFTKQIVDETYRSQDELQQFDGIIVSDYNRLINKINIVHRDDIAIKYCIRKARNAVHVKDYSLREYKKMSRMRLLMGSINKKWHNFWKGLRDENYYATDDWKSTDFYRERKEKSLY